tara:strand:+ start:28 stop:768 length:741 start_codon:yes stop_codon:yes gene_type:complete
MTEMMPNIAMILAAGFGKRLRPITDKTPKPMLKVAGRTLLDHSIDHLADSGIEKVVINIHHLGSLIEQHITRRTDVEVVISDESDELLETGGGIMKALPLLGEDPFFVINGDVLWLDGPSPALQRLADTWDHKHMDALLLLHSTVEAYGYDGTGDFMVDPEGALVRQPEREVSPYLFAGVQILQAKAFAEAPAGPFSLNLIFDRAIEQGRLFGLINDGEWFHIGTAGGLSEAEGYFRQRFPGIRRR